MSDILYDSGVLSDVDIREFWGKGIEIDTYQKGDWAFDLDKQLQLGSIDLRFRPDYKKFNLNEKDTIKYDSILQKRYTTPYDLDVDEKPSSQSWGCCINNNTRNCQAIRRICRNSYWTQQHCPSRNHGSLLPRIHQSGAWTANSLAVNQPISTDSRIGS